MNHSLIKSIVLALGLGIAGISLAQTVTMNADKDTLEGNKKLNFYVVTEGSLTSLDSVTAQTNPNQTQVDLKQGNYYVQVTSVEQTGKLVSHTYCSIQPYDFGQEKVNITFSPDSFKEGVCSQ